MYAARRSKERGFTLVEILIVVIILGILAAIVIPQFTSASTDARQNSTKSLLQTIRSQVELYKLQHSDNLPGDDTGSGTPTFAEFWDDLTLKTDLSGATDADDPNLGPYLQSKPVNPLNGKSDVSDEPGDDVGFVLTTDGKVFATGKDPTMYFDENSNADSATVPGSAEVVD